MAYLMAHRTDSTSKVIRTITTDMDISQYIQTGKSSFGRGGMLTKSNIAHKIAEEGIEVIIANGKKDNILLRLD
jgi:glutamate 5-kinase